MGEEQIINLIGSLGFPIATAWFLMVKLDKTLQSLSDNIGKLLNRLPERE